MKAGKLGNNTTTFIPVSRSTPILLLKPSLHISLSICCPAFLSLKATPWKCRCSDSWITSSSSWSCTRDSSGKHEWSKMNYVKKFTPETWSPQVCKVSSFCLAYRSGLFKNNPNTFPARHMLMKSILWLFVGMVSTLLTCLPGSCGVESSVGKRRDTLSFKMWWPSGAMVTYLQFITPSVGKCNK